MNGRWNPSGDALARRRLGQGVRRTRQIVRDRVAEATRISALGLAGHRHLDLREIACVYGAYARRLFGGGREDGVDMVVAALAALQHGSVVAFDPAGVVVIDIGLCQRPPDDLAALSREDADALSHETDDPAFGLVMLQREHA